MKTPEEITLKDLPAESQDLILRALQLSLYNWRNLATTRRLFARQGSTHSAMLSRADMQGWCRAEMRFRLDVMRRGMSLWKAWVNWVNNSCRVYRSDAFEVSTVQDVINGNHMNATQCGFYNLFTSLINQHLKSQNEEAKNESAEEA